MTERSRFWDGLTVGDASEARYDSFTEFAQVLMSLAAANAVPTNRGGVFHEELNELAVTGAVSPVSVATGRALVYGAWYETDAAISVAIPTPAGATRIDRIVLRKSWVGQTVRVVRIVGVEGGGAPVLLQIAGTTWDIPLAQVSITTGGVITVTDQREFIPHHGDRSGEPGVMHTAVQISGVGNNNVIKAADEIVNNSAALQNDADFLFSIGANEKYIIELNLCVTGVTIAADFRFTFTVPAGATGLMMYQTRDGEDSAALGVSTVITSATEPLNIRIQASIENGATPGVVQFQWAQGTATVIDTTIKEFSQMVVHLVE